jgi:hypothetical protein
MDTTTIVAIVVLALILIGLAGWYYARQVRSHKLRERFGPEYHQTVRTLKSREAAEAELAEREKRVSRFNIVPLSAADCARYEENWTSVQSEFVDHPDNAVLDANRLVREVMQKRGYPISGFEQAAADLSVDHPAVVENYRAAHRIAERSQRGEADTEELRQAIVYYRALFQDLLGSDRVASAGRPSLDRDATRRAS